MTPQMWSFNICVKNTYVMETHRYNPGIIVVAQVYLATHYPAKRTMPSRSINGQSVLALSLLSTDYHTCSAEKQTHMFSGVTSLLFTGLYLLISSV